MSNLGAIGSQDYENQNTTEPDDSQKGSLPFSLEDQKAQTIEQISKLITSTQITERSKAMKMLIAMMSKGHDMRDFAPFVTQQVASSDPQCRQLAYIFLNHYSSECTETVLLSINTFQRSLTDNDPIIRALAIKMISSIPQRDIIPQIQSAVEQVIGDPSPYVKKAAAYAIIKAAELDPNYIDNYLPFIDRLLGETNPIAFSGAIAAYWSICPMNIEFIHPRFRFICQNITKFDEFAQIFTLRSLTFYVRLCFKNPAEEEAAAETETAFWDENPAKENISSDHLMVISAAKKCLNSLNPAVTLAAVSFLYYCAPASHLNVVARPLVRLLYDNSLSSQISLTTILTIATQHPHIFVPHLNHFFIRKNDNKTVQNLKFKVLTALTSPSNADTIINEIITYTGSPDLEFAALAVKTIGKNAMINQSIIPSCLASLLKLMNRAEGPVLAETVLVIATILRLKRGTDDEAQALRNLCRKFTAIKEPTARAAVLSIVGDMHETHPEFAPQLLRYIAQNFANESPEVRIQSLTLAAKLISIEREKGSDATPNSQVPMYLLKICERDTEFDVRDRARFLVTLIESKSEKISKNLRTLLFPERKMPKWTTADELNDYQVGTFSHFFDREVPGYDQMIDWAPEEELPDESVRIPPKNQTFGGYDSPQMDLNNDANGGDDQGLDMKTFFSDDEGAEYEEDEEEEEHQTAAGQPADENVEYYEYEEEEQAEKPNGGNAYDNFFD